MLHDIDQQCIQGFLHPHSFFNQFQLVPWHEQIRYQVSNKKQRPEQNNIPFVIRKNSKEFF